MSSEQSNLRLLIDGLAGHLGRIPTEQEVETFIFGTTEERMEVLNGALPSSEGGS